MNSMIKSGICLACILAGLFMHLFYPGDVTYWAGIALIFISPLILAPKTPKAPTYHASDPKTRWFDIPDADVASTYNRLSAGSQPTNYGLGCERVFYKGCLNIVVLTIAAFSSFGAWSVDETLLAAIIIDIVAVPWALLHLKYGSDPGDALAFKQPNGVGDINVKLPNIQLIYASLLGIRGIKPILQLEVSHSDLSASYFLSNEISDIRISIKFDTPIDGVLCSMVSVSKNNVQGTHYPYSYFVVVFKGQGVSESSDMHTELTSIQSQHFLPEINLNDGNTVLVITKKSGTPEYTTNIEDCSELVEIISQTYLLLERNRKRIKRLTKE